MFQDFNLLETLSVYDNMVLPLVLARRPIEEMEKKVKPIAEMLGIEDLLKKNIHMNYQGVNNNVWQSVVP